MSSQEIKKRLAELQRELESTPSVDDDLRKLLMELDGDIHELLARDEPAQAEVQGVRDRLEALTAEFDARHPNTTIFFHEIIDALARLGI